jgi:TPR repeat protein
MYEAGRGVPHDLPLAHMWFTLSAAAGNQDAARRREVAEARMSVQEKERSREMGREWRERYANE